MITGYFKKKCNFEHFNLNLLFFSSMHDRKLAVYENITYKYRLQAFVGFNKLITSRFVPLPDFSFANHSHLHIFYY